MIKHIKKGMDIGPVGQIFRNAISYFERLHEFISPWQILHSPLWLWHGSRWVVEVSGLVFTDADGNADVEGWRVEDWATNVRWAEESVAELEI